MLRKPSKRLIIYAPTAYRVSVHAPVHEPHCSIAYWEGKRVTIHSAHQSAHYLQHHIARIFNMKEGDVRYSPLHRRVLEANLMSADWMLQPLPFQNNRTACQDVL